MLNIHISVGTITKMIVVAVVVTVVTILAAVVIVVLAPMLEKAVSYNFSL